jgi:hypothetical protein
VTGDAAVMVSRTVRFREGGRLRRTTLRMERLLWDRVQEIIEAEGITRVEFFTRVRALNRGSFVGAVRLVAIGIPIGGPGGSPGGGAGRPRDQAAAARWAQRARDAAMRRRPVLRLVE